ncbi:MAG: hypothetical protein HeimC3_50050 [Candidatus Heimdallarchaeota archaeon LC_3]|nr:MAG: hypothetical protein HeimC3_50050 [Candidatus Heimdallarchaeota archaeon LC_3]
MLNIDQITREIENRFRPRSTYTHESSVVRDYFNMCLKYNLKPLRDINRVFIEYEDIYDDCLDSMREKLPDYIPPHIRRKDRIVLFNLRELFYDDLTFQVSSKRTEIISE